MSEPVQQKRGRGRPKQRGRGLGILVRLHEEELLALDAWINFAGAQVSRPVALRQLAQLALDGMKYRPRDERTEAALGTRQRQSAG